MFRIQRSHLVTLGFTLAMLGSGLVHQAQGADPAFVGVLAIAVEPAVAQQLEIPEDVRAKLIALVDKRETEALELALQIKDLPATERAAKLAPFVAESEKQGLALLNEEQKKKLVQIRVSRAGMSGLVDAAIAEKLGLTRAQTVELNKLLTEMQEAMAGASEDKRRIAKAYYEPKLAAVMTKEQRAAWEQLAGVAAGGAAPPVAGATAGTPAPSSAASSAPSTPAQSAAPGESPRRSASARGPSPDGKVRFQFHHAPWKDVLEWFATQADYSLVMKSPPLGVFNYSDRRAYSPAEAIDLLNYVLLTEGYTLVRRERMLVLINLEDGIPPDLVPIVSVKELDERGDNELVRCVFQLSRLTTDKAKAEVDKMIGPQGQAVPLVEAKQLMVTETAGKLRLIRDMIAAVESPEAPKNERIVELKLEHVGATEFLAMARPLLGIPDGMNATQDGTLRLAVDDLGFRVFATGTPDRIDRVQEILKLIDVGGDAADAGPGIQDQAQLKIYSITQADPAAVLQVLQTILAGEADVRLAIDPKTGNLVAFAKLSHHATIKATLEQMQADGTKVEVIKLRQLDPQAAMLAINKLFGGADAASAANAPKIDADPINMQLMIRGTAGQVAQIRDLLEKMGEIVNEEEQLGPTARTTVRMLPLTGRAARTVLEQVEAIWSTTRGNSIRVVTPTQGNIPAGSFGARPAFAPQPQYPPARGPAFDPNSPQIPQQGVSPSSQPANQPPQPAPQTEGTRPAPVPGAAPPNVRPDADDNRTTRTNLHSARFYFVSQPLEEKAEETTPQPAKAKEAEEPAVQTPPAAAPAKQDSSREAFDPRVVEYVDNMLAEQDANKDGFIDSEEWKFGKWSTPPTTSDLDKDNRLSKAELYLRVAKRFNLLEPPANAVAPGEPASKAGAEIVVTMGPGGLIIASEDLDALDEFEQLLRQVAEGTPSGGKEFAIFYLKFAKAEIASTLLQEILGGGAGSTDTGGGGGSLMGDIATGMLGDVGGGLFGSLMGGGGGGGGGGTTTASGSVSVVPDIRLNALVVQATARDLDTVEQLLKIIDQPASPEAVQTVAAARTIQIINASADEVAATLRQVFAGRIQGESSQQRQPSPEDFIRALRGGGSSRGGRGGSQANRGEEQKMTIGVDLRTNSLLISAPDYLFDEVKAVVAQLDTATVAADETIRVVSLRQSNADLVQRSLQTMLGTGMTASKTSPTSQTSSSSSNRSSSNGSRSSSGNSSSGRSSSGNDGGGGSNFDQIRQQMEMFNQLRGGGDSGRSSRGGFGGFGGGGSGFGRGGDSGGFGRGDSSGFGRGGDSSGFGRGGDSRGSSSRGR